MRSLLFFLLLLTCEAFGQKTTLQASIIKAREEFWMKNNLVTDVATDTAFIGALDTRIPSQLAVKKYADRRIGGDPFINGSKANGWRIGWNGTAWVPVANTATLADGDRGDVNISGTGSVFTVDGLQGRSVVSTAPTANQVLKWNGSAWAPGTDDNTGTTYTAGTGIGIAGTVISNTGDTNASDDIIGGGTTGYLPLFLGTQTLNNSVLFQSGSRVGINTTSPASDLTISNANSSSSGGLRLHENTDAGNYWTVFTGGSGNYDNFLNFCYNNGFVANLSNSSGLQLFSGGYKMKENSNTTSGVLLSPIEHSNSFVRFSRTGAANIDNTLDLQGWYGITMRGLSGGGPTLQLDQFGKVGIGLSTTFDAMATIKGGGATSATYGLAVHNSTGSNNALMVRDDGNIGMGTNNPLEPLTIRRNNVATATASILLANSRTDVANTAATGVFMLDEMGQTEWFMGRPNAAPNDRIDFCRVSTTAHSNAAAVLANTVFSILPTNVYLQSNAPRYIASSTAGGSLATPARAGMEFRSVSGQYILGEVVGESYTNNTLRAGLAFRVSPDVTQPQLNTALYIRGDNNYTGLNTIDPQRHLHVQGTARITGSAGSGGNILLRDSNGDITNAVSLVGLSIAGTTLTNTGDTDASNDVTNTSTAGGDLSGTFSNLQLINNAVGALEIADQAVTTAKIADNAVTNIKVNDGAITTTKVADGAITLQKMAPASVNSNIIVNGSVAALDFADQGATTGQPLVYGGAGVGFVPGTSGGDVTGPYTNLQIAANAVTSAEIADNSVNSSEIANGAVQAADLFFSSYSLGSTIYSDGANWIYGQQRVFGYNDINSGGGVGSITLSGNRIDNLLRGSNWTDLTVNMPTSPADGQVTTLSCDVTATAVTWSGNGNTLVGSLPTTIAPGSTFGFKFYSANSKWIRIN